MKKENIDDKLFHNRFRVDTDSHLEIIDQSVCLTKCKGQPCVTFCPAFVYRPEDGRIAVNYEGCLECGSCRIGCPYKNIKWRFPKGGCGISHKFG